MNHIKSRIIELHSNSEGIPDHEQLKVIFSSNDRVIVEAPAGYGKTKTMISKIAYLIASNQVPSNKKILTLTFSVNAAYKIKRDISEKLPLIFVDSYGSPTDLKKKIFASNYHGLCRRILQLYGYLLSSELNNIENLKGIDDSEYSLGNLGLGLNRTEIRQISILNEKVKKIDLDYVQRNYDFYLEKVAELLLPKGYIPFNAILLFTLKLFEEYPHILKFYRSYFPIIIIDEYQDTNILSAMILKKLITENTKLILMGDPLQRIYGFIGAIKNIMSDSQHEFSMERIELKNNHRFNDNPEMLQLDKNIRENAKDIKNPQITTPANIIVLKARNQFAESTMVLDTIKRLLKDHPSDKIAILVRLGTSSINTRKLLEVFDDDDSLNYFNALFNDDDEEYIDFHHVALQEFMNVIQNSKVRVFKTISNNFLNRVQRKYRRNPKLVFQSLFKLLESFLELIAQEFKFLTPDEKIEFIKDTLENRALKQYLEYIDSNVVIATIHGAKGLEWEYVIIPDMEQDSLPTWRGICQNCVFKDSCEIDWSKADEMFEHEIYEELSVFYVGSTRAKKQVIFSYSKSGVYRSHRKNVSCLLKIKGINPI